jgi:hypothetical protein
MKTQPTVDQVKRTIEELPREVRFELTQWLLQRYIAGGLLDSGEALELRGDAFAEVGERLAT